MFSAWELFNCADCAIIAVVVLASGCVMANQQTDRTKAIIIKNIPHHTLRALDEEAGEFLNRNGGYFDVTILFRGLLKPIIRFCFEHREPLSRTND